MTSPDPFVCLRLHQTTPRITGVKRLSTDCLPRTGSGHDGCMSWEESMFAVFDDLEQQAAGLHLAERDAEVADLSLAEYSRGHPGPEAARLRGPGPAGPPAGGHGRRGPARPLRAGLAAAGGRGAEWIVRCEGITSLGGLSAARRQRGHLVGGRPVDHARGAAPTRRGERGVPGSLLRRPAGRGPDRPRGSGLLRAAPSARGPAGACRSCRCTRWQPCRAGGEPGRPVSVAGVGPSTKGWSRTNFSASA